MKFLKNAYIIFLKIKVKFYSMKIPENRPIKLTNLVLLTLLSVLMMTIPWLFPISKASLVVSLLGFLLFIWTAIKYLKYGSQY